MKWCLMQAIYQVEFISILLKQVNMHLRNLMKTTFYNNKILLVLFLIMAFNARFYAQTTTVTPVLSLAASGIADQDDMCIWIAPDASQSIVITSDKGANKLFVYDLAGNTLQTVNVPGKPGNIDIRYNFLLFVVIIPPPKVFIIFLVSKLKKAA